MNKMKSLTAALFGVAFVAMSGAAMANTHASVNGHRPSDHTLDSTGHPYDMRQPNMSGFSTLSQRDRELQRIDDIKRQTTDGYMGAQPILR